MQPLQCWLYDAHCKRLARCSNRTTFCAAPQSKWDMRGDLSPAQPEMKGAEEGIQQERRQRVEIACIWASSGGNSQAAEARLYQWVDQLILMFSSHSGRLIFQPASTSATNWRFHRQALCWHLSWPSAKTSADDFQIGEDCALSELGTIKRANSTTTSVAKCMSRTRSSLGIEAAWSFIPGVMEVAPFTQTSLPDWFKNMSAVQTNA